MYDFAGVLLRRPNIDQSAGSCLHEVEHVIAERADGIVSFLRGIRGGGVVGCFAGVGATFCFPLSAAAIHHPCIGMAEVLEKPEGVDRCTSCCDRRKSL